MHTSDPTFRVLHVLRLRGLSSREAVAAVTDQDVDALDAMLATLAAEGQVRERTGGRMAGWALTRGGRARHGEMLERDRSDGDLPTVLEPSYRRFLEVNQPFIDLCSDWQIRSDSGEPNDHTDDTYDAEIVRRLGDVHTVGARVAADTADLAERYGSYGPRLEHALAQVRDGHREWLTSPTIDSYHTVWFEMHEDLLQSQGIERTEGA